MIYCKIRWDNANQLSILPSTNVGKESFSEFRTKIYEDGSIDRCLEYRDRITDTITVSSNNTLDGSGAISSGIYYLYACFKNHKLDTIGLCQDGNTPVNYDYYQKISPYIPVNSSNEFTELPDLDIDNNVRTNKTNYDLTGSGTFNSVPVAHVDMFTTTPNTGDITINGLEGGLIYHTVVISKLTSANNVIFTHNSGSGNEVMFNPTAANVTLANYGAYTLFCRTTQTYWWLY